MVHPDRHIDTTFVVKLHDLRHIDGTVIMEGLPVGIQIAQGVAEVDEEDLVLEIGDDLVKILAHDVIGRLTHSNAQHIALHNAVHSPVNIGCAGHDPLHTAQIPWGIVRVQCQLDAMLFGCWQHSLQEIGVVVPQLLLGDLGLHGLEVIDSKGESTKYEVAAEGEYLRQAMEDAEGLEFSGHDSMYGLILDTVNGETVDEESGTTWVLKVNGEECKSGIDREPVEDEDHFQIIYTQK